MNINPQEFPRRGDRKRRAEARVYDELAGSNAPGHVLYEVKPRADAPECDFAILMEVSRAVRTAWTAGSGPWSLTRVSRR